MRKEAAEVGDLVEENGCAGTDVGRGRVLGGRVVRW